MKFYTKEKGAPYVLDAFSVLEYVANVIDLQEGAYAERIFQKFFPSSASIKVFEHCYWASHCKYFQKNSGDVLHSITDELAALYVQLMDSITKETFKAIFFKYYIHAIGFAVGIGFFYHCPGSRNMYDAAQTSFKLDVCQYISSLLCGMDLLPESANLMSSTLFGETLIVEKKRMKVVTKDAMNQRIKTVKFSAFLILQSPKQKQRDHRHRFFFRGKRCGFLQAILHKSASSAANAGVSPLVEQFLVGKTFETFQKMKKKTTSHGHTSPLSLKRSGPPRKSYRLPTASSRVSEMREIMKDLKAKYKFKVRSCNSDIRASKERFKAQSV